MKLFSLNFIGGHRGCASLHTNSHLCCFSITEYFKMCRIFSVTIVIIKTWANLHYHTQTCSLSSTLCMFLISCYFHHPVDVYSWIPLSSIFIDPVRYVLYVALFPYVLISYCVPLGFVKDRSILRVTFL